MTIFPRYVGAGLQDANYLVRLGASNHGGVTVRVTSSDATKVLVSPNARRRAPTMSTSRWRTRTPGCRPRPGSGPATESHGSATRH